jgi:hypothetical protein
MKVSNAQQPKVEQPKPAPAQAQQKVPTPPPQAAPPPKNPPHLGKAVDTNA